MEEANEQMPLDFVEKDSEKNIQGKRKISKRFTGRTTGTLRLISLVTMAMKKTNFEEDSTKTFKLTVEKLKNYFSLNEIQVILFCSLFTLYFDNTGRPVSFYNISDFYNCNPLVPLQYYPELAGIIERGILEEVEHEDSTYGKPFYKVPEPPLLPRNAPPAPPLTPALLPAA